MLRPCRSVEEGAVGGGGGDNLGVAAQVEFESKFSRRFIIF